MVKNVSTGVCKVVETVTYYGVVYVYLYPSKIVTDVTPHMDGEVPAPNWLLAVSLKKGIVKVLYVLIWIVV